MVANKLWWNPEYATVEYYLCCPDIKLLACHDSYEAVTQQQYSVRGLFRLVARLTAIENPYYLVPTASASITLWWYLDDESHDKMYFPWYK